MEALISSETFQNSSHRHGHTIQQHNQHFCLSTLQSPWIWFLNSSCKGRVLGGSSCKWRHLVLEASRLLSLCLVVPPCWRRFITSLNKSRLHQNPIFCPIFLLFFLFVCFFSFCLLAGLRTAQKKKANFNSKTRLCPLAYRME